MSYIINKTDGSQLTIVVDGTIDQTATDLTLIGKNASSYGESFNENFIKLLENFANGTAPLNPIPGQLWFDTTQNRLKVYDGNIFKVSGGTIVSPSTPVTPVAGDLWINNQTQQLKFYDGSIWILTGPVYTQDQGTSGFIISNIIDTINKSHTVAEMWVAGKLFGIFSLDEFTPLATIPNFVGNISPGFNISNYINPTTGQPLQFKAEVDISNRLKSPSEVDAVDIIEGLEYSISSLGTTDFIAIGAADNILGLRFTATGTGTGTGKVRLLLTSDNFVTSSGDSVIVGGTLTIQSDFPLILGPGQNNEIRVDSNSFDIRGNNSGQNFSVKLKPTSGNPKGFILYNPGTFTLNTLDATGDGTYATLTFEEQLIPPFAVGDIISVSFIIPTGYRGSYTVTDCTTTTVSYENSTTQSQSTTGTVELVILPRFGILTDTPLATLDVNGSAVVRGNLTVLGDTTIIYTSTLAVTDKNIELAKPEDNTSPTDTLADGGGITLKGTTDKTFNWRNAVDPVNQYWASSESINLAVDKTFKIEGVDVLTATSLGNNITSAPGISSLGHLNSLSVANFTISSNTISAAAGDLILAPAGINTVNVSGKKITGLATAALGTDAVNKTLLETYVRTRSLGMAVNINNSSGGSLTNGEIVGLLQEVYPAGEYDEGTICRVHCTYTTVSYNDITFSISDSNPAANITKTFDTVDKGAGTSTVVQDIVVSNAIDAGNGVVTTTRTLKIYTVTSGIWAFTSSTASGVTA